MKEYEIDQCFVYNQVDTKNDKVGVFGMEEIVHEGGRGRPLFSL